ncbi:hypothetical protein H4217_002291 [Coemansia sp. RSA 1939]|nr:hypothetical protein H4217_002291 [Coemansia sp. RSA 1939]KAJ2616134.1 hypothetical protein EV177_001219 [Coemansia sp. RSA 1804]KAJ2682724.1 hypothetical protein GGH99_004623 [Coemansia sp. RSA 1285]
MNTTTDSSGASLVGWEVLDKWLKDLYAPDQLPPLVSSSSSTPQLHRELSRLYTTSSIIRESQSIVAQIQAESTLEYTALSARLHKILQPLRLVPADLSPAARDALSGLSQLACELGGVSDLRVESFERAVAARTIEQFENSLRAEKARDQTRALRQKISESQERQRRLRALLDSRQTESAVEEQKTREWLRNSAIVAQKTNEYRARLDQMMAEDQKEEAGRAGGRRIVTLRDTRGGSNGVVEYAQIKELDATVNELQGAVDERRAACAGYSALPPDIQLAYLNLEEARQTLEQLRVDCERAVAAAFDTPPVISTSSRRRGM